MSSSSTSQTHPTQPTATTNPALTQICFDGFPDLAQSDAKIGPLSPDLNQYPAKVGTLVPDLTQVHAKVGPFSTETVEKVMPVAPMISYATAASRPRLIPRFKPIILPSRQYSTIDGKPSVHFTAAEFEAGVALFKHSLVAKFTMGRPTIEVIRQTFKENWHIKGRATVSDIWDSRHLMVILDSEEDANAVLTSPLRKVGHAMFRLFRYSPDYSPKKESSTTTKWVRLPGIHPGFVTRNYVASIVNSFGFFLDLDERSKACSTLKYVRACVELDVCSPIPDEIRITLSDGRIFWQKIEVEGNLAYCSYCKVHGHEMAMCRKKQAVKNDPKDQVKLNNQKERYPAETIAQNRPLNQNKGATGNKEEWVQVKKKKSARKVKFSNNNEDVKLSNNTVAEGVNNEEKIKEKKGDTQVEKEVITTDGTESIVASEEVQETAYMTNSKTGSSLNAADEWTVVQKRKGKQVDLNVHHDASKDEEMTNPNTAMVLYIEPHTSEQVDDPKPSKPVERIGEDVVFEIIDNGQIYCEKLGGNIFQDMEEFVQFAKENGYAVEELPSLPIEDSAEGDHEVTQDNESCDQNDDDNPSRMTIISSQQKTRHQKKKGSRSSARSCPKVKDPKFVW